jgi:hypothetical protein
MKKVQSVSLLALLAVSGSTLATSKTDNSLIEICTQIEIEEISPKAFSTNAINSEVVIREIEAGRISKVDVEKICRFLKENEQSINNDNSTIDKGTGWSMGQ